MRFIVKAKQIIKLRSSVLDVVNFKLYNYRQEILASLLMLLARVIVFLRPRPQTQTVLRRVQSKYLALARMKQILYASRIHCRRKVREHILIFHTIILK